MFCSLSRIDVFENSLVLHVFYCCTRILFSLKKLWAQNAMQSTKHTIKSEPPVKMFGFSTATFFRSLCAFMMLLVLFSPIIDMVNDYVGNSQVSTLQPQHEANEHHDHYEPITHFLYSTSGIINAAPTHSFAPCFSLLQHSYCIALSIEHPPEELLFS